MEVVNVIEIRSGLVETVKSFVILNEEDKDRITKEAEEYFKELIENYDEDITDEDMEVYIEDGEYNNQFFGYSVILTWSI